MWLFVLESLAALALLVFMVWWTMFSGRRRGEREQRPADETGGPVEPEDGPPRA